MLKIYHAPGTRSVRPIWLCYELGLDFEIVRIDFSPVFRNSREWRALSPAGKVPILADETVTMFESGAMVDYILERYGEGRLRPPPGTPQSAMHHQWCWFSEATLIRPLGVSGLLKRHADQQASLAADGLQKVKDCLAVVDTAVADRDFLLGSTFGAADVMMGYALELLASFRLLDDRYPAALAYLGRLRTREAFKRALSA